MKIRINEKQLKFCVNDNITEQSLGDYPEGADNDPNAPWNRDDIPEAEIEDIEIVDDDVDNFEDVYVIFINELDAEAEMNLEDLLDGVNMGDAQMAYFNNSIKQYPRPADWEQRIMFVARIYAKVNELDYKGGKEFEEPEDDGFDYRDKI